MGLPKADYGALVNPHNRQEVLFRLQQFAAPDDSLTALVHHVMSQSAETNGLSSSIDTPPAISSNKSTNGPAAQAVNTSLKISCPPPPSALVISRGPALSDRSLASVFVFQATVQGDVSAADGTSEMSSTPSDSAGTTSAPSGSSTSNEKTATPATTNANPAPSGPASRPRTAAHHHANRRLNPAELSNVSRSLHSCRSGSARRPSNGGVCAN